MNSHTISVSDLLPRRERVLDMSRVRMWLRGKRIAVTGAGGFIGSELSRQVSSFEPLELLLLDNSEYNLWKISRELPAARAEFADVRSAYRLRHLLHNVDIVFHAAAMKHVPICEVATEDAYATNAAGTRHVVDSARKAQVVLVSTDKAVRPSSVMGKTKRLAEEIVRGTSRGSVVRFGNVIGSSGSVVPLFQEQLARGGPLTVTHEDMTRYFMTVGEAAELILQAGTLGAGTYVLDMGEPVRIMDVARDMIRLSGRRDADIIVTGIRGGEKLAEELSTEPLVPTDVDGVMRVVE